MTAKQYVLVGCGASKRDEPAPARELYDSTYFAKKRDFGDTFAIDWWVVSAKHGLVTPDTVLEPYDTTVKDVDTGAWLSTLRADLAATGVLDDEAAVIWVLIGSRYLDAQAPARQVGAGVGSLRSLLATAAGTVHFPFESTEGIGEQMAWLGACVEARDLRLPGGDDPEGAPETSDRSGNASLTRF